MKGLLTIPTMIDLSKAYSTLQSLKNKITIREVVLWSQWSRLDARLAEQLVLYVSNHWQTVSPIELNLEIQKEPWPSAMGVILEHARLGLSKKTDVNFFKQWMTLGMFGIQKANHEQFFIGSFSIGSALMRNKSKISTKPYLQWGYLGSDYLWNKQKPKKTISSKQSRLNVIDQMLKNKKRFTVSEYMHQLEGAVGRRQAERDLVEHTKLKAIGNTRARSYVGS